MKPLEISSMSTLATQNGAEAVVIRRSGHEPVALHPAPRVSLADHLRSLGLTPQDHNVLIDGRSLMEAFVPPPGCVVMVFPKPPGEKNLKPLKLSVGRFADDPLFDDMMAEIQARREADRASL